MRLLVGTDHGVRVLAGSESGVRVLAGSESGVRERLHQNRDQWQTLASKAINFRFLERHVAQ